MDINQAFAGDYLKEADLGGQPRILIMGQVTMAKLGDDEAPKPILHFQGQTRCLALNKTNANTIATMFGPHTEHWIGQHLELYPDVTQYGGRTVPCIRVRKPGGQPQPAPVPAPSLRANADHQPTSTGIPAYHQDAPVDPLPWD